MRTNKIWLSIVIILAMLNSSCDKQRIYDEYISIPSTGWSKDSVALFDVPINSPEKGHSIFINIRNNTDYNHSNLWLFLDAKSPSGLVDRDTIEYILADPKGKWYGRGWGGVYHLRLPYKFNVTFKEKGVYQFRLQQGMRTPEVIGIQDVGIRVEFVKE